MKKSQVAAAMSKLIEQRRDPVRKAIDLSVSLEELRKRKLRNMFVFNSEYGSFGSQK